MDDQSATSINGGAGAGADAGADADADVDIASDAAVANTDTTSTSTSTSALPSLSLSLSSTVHLPRTPEDSVVHPDFLVITEKEPSIKDQLAAYKQRRLTKKQQWNQQQQHGTIDIDTI